MRKVPIIAAIALIVILAVVLLTSRQDTYHVDDRGVLHTQTHTDLHATKLLVQEQQNYALYRTTYDSYGRIIVGNLYLPREPRAKMLLLPGGGVTKEGEANAAKYFVSRGYAVLTIDQRGVGETQGGFRSIDQDYAAFEQGEIPTNHLLILDALAGIQFLHEQRLPGKTLLAGESMGGRAAMVAARISTDIDALLIISSAGFGNPQLPAEQSRFLKSFDPDANIGSVHVPVVFVHSTNDTTILLASSNGTFTRAQEPKKIIIIDQCMHGYCSDMQQALDEALAWIDEKTASGK